GTRPDVAPRIGEPVDRPPEQHVRLGHGVRRQPFEVRLPSRLAMAELLWPLPGYPDREERVERIERASAQVVRNVRLRVRTHDATIVFGDVPRAQPALDDDTVEARV